MKHLNYLHATALFAFCTISLTVSALTAGDIEQIWVLKGLDAPESIVPAANESFYFVSNVNGEGSDKDGNGYIARISLRGEMLEQHWLDGLDAPKGMAVADNTLYVADIDQLVVIDIDSATIRQRIAIEGAGFLNDVAIDNDDTVLISDSANSRIYAVADATGKQATVRVWLENPRLEGINGLFPRTDDVLITTMSAGELISMKRADQSLTTLAGGMPNADGIVTLAGGFLISSWPGQLHHVDLQGKVKTIYDTSDEQHYMNDIVRLGDRVLVPNWQPGSVTAYRLR